MVKIMEENDKIQVKCKGGFNIVRKASLFSSDGQYVYFPWNNILRCYSVETGEAIADYEGLNDDVISARIHPLNSKLVVACSKSGDIAVWQSNVLISKNKIKCDLDEVLTFHLIVQEDKTENAECVILLSYLHLDQCYISTFTFNTLTIKTSLPFYHKFLALEIGGATGPSPFLAVIKKNRLYYMNLNGSNKVYKYKLGDGKTFTCLACHPEQNCVATGDSTGRIIIWHGFLKNSYPTQSIHHWHSLPVNTLMFSQSGSILYSGADECVLVRWRLDTLHKDFLPRLPAPLLHLSAAPDNIFMAVSLQNNSVHIIDAQLRVKRVIQLLTWSATMSAGLHVDARTKSLVFNGNVGNLQFYSPHTMSLLYNLDIVGQNKLTRERKLSIPNTNVSKVALTKLGEWLACVEERQDNDNYPEIRLKFFHFDSTNQTFGLNTSIEFPHENGVNGLEFEPTCSSTDILCVTTGNDKQFKIWSLVDTTDIYRKSRAWRCLSTGNYKNFPANAISFSIDGSLIAVAFGPSLTAWSPYTCDLKCSLVHPSYRLPLTKVQFGNGDQCHLVVTTTSDRLSVWNLLTLALVWTVPVQITHLCMDPLSTYLAGFTHDNGLFVFTPGSGTPVFSKKPLTSKEDKITGVCFVPHKTDRTDGLSWQRMSQLYFINANQELLCLESETHNSNDIALEYSARPEKSTFEAFLAETVTSSKQNQTTPQNHKETGIARATKINQLLEPPIHTMAPMRFLCNSVLRSLILKNSGVDDISVDIDAEESDDEFEPSESDTESDKELSKRRGLKTTKPKVAQVPAKINKESLKAVMAEPHSWISVLLD